MDPLDRFISENFAASQIAPSALTSKIASRVFGTPDKLVEETEKIAHRMECYLDQFVGTELYDQAVGLCEEEMKLEAASIQRRMASMQENPARDEDWLKRDMICLQKNQLELALHKLRATAGGQGPGPEAPAVAADQTAAVPPPAAAAPAVEPAKTASYGSLSKCSSMPMGEDEPGFLDRFVGTELYEQAAALVQQALDLEEEQLQRRMKEDAERAADDTWTKRQAIDLAKKKLELQLHGLESQKATAPALASAAPKTAAFILAALREKEAAIDLGALAAKAKPGLGAVRREIPQAAQLSAARRSIPAQMAGAGKAVPPPIPAAAHDPFRSPQALSFGKRGPSSSAPVKTMPFSQHPKEMQQHAEGLHMLSERAAKGDAATRASTLNLAKRMGVHGDVSASVLAHDKGLSKYAMLRALIHSGLRTA